MRLIETLEGRLMFATFTVVNASDSGPGSLRQALLDANAAAGLDTIQFNIGAGGAATIAPLSELPDVNDPLVLDGTTQPGFAGTPIIELNGQNAGDGTNGLRLRAGGSTVRGLVINRFGSDGISLSSNGGNTIVGNYIGTDASGTLPRPNRDAGIDVGTNGNTIGGPAPADRNLISGNVGPGIVLEDDDNNVTNNLIRGNFIGTDVTGALAIPNAGPGVRIINGVNNRIGADVAGAGNVIAFNIGDGVEVQSGFNNTILGNSIFQNQQLGIDLAPEGVTPNDAGDADVGANELQNFPVLTGTVSANGLTTVSGTLSSTASGTFRVEIFANPSADPSGFGEGRTFLGATAVTTDASGAASFQVDIAALPADATSVTATASEPLGSTSEFSQALPVNQDTVAPAVASSEFRFSGSTLPTPPHRLVYSFSEDVSASLSAADLVLENATTGATVSAASIALSYDAGTNTATFTFPGLAGGLLPDGNYTARLADGTVSDAAGNALDGNGDGTAGGEHVMPFFFLLADFNHDGTVNLNDFNILANNFGQGPRDFTQGDANYDGQVDLSDFNLLAGRFGRALAGSRGGGERSFSDRAIAASVDDPLDEPV